MDAPPSHEITQLLLAWCNGDQAALGKLMPLVYDELHRLANRYMKRERSGHTLQTSALINEVYLRLIDASEISWQNRAHFFAISSNLMRRILIDHARDRLRDKRGGGAPQVSLDEALTVPINRSEELIALDEALDRLAAVDPFRSKIVEMRFFGGMTFEETAEALVVAPHKVKYEWQLARAFLHDELSGSE